MEMISLFSLVAAITVASATLANQRGALRKMPRLAASVLVTRGHSLLLTLHSLSSSCVIDVTLVHALRSRDGPARHHHLRRPRRPCKVGRCTPFALSQCHRTYVTAAKLDASFIVAIVAWIVQIPVVILIGFDNEHPPQ